MQDEYSDTDSVVVDPGLPIIDSHHHLWLSPHGRYLLDEFAADLNSGHRVLATVYVECGAMYRTRGPDTHRTVGEAEFAAGVAAMSESGLWGPAEVCAAFVGAADLTMGAELDSVLDALQVASGERLRGIRGVAAWDADPSINTGIRPYAPQGLLHDARFRAGVARLAKRGLTYDAWQYHPQLADLCDLADAFPHLPIVVNHCGGLLGVGAYATQGEFDRWAALIADVARRPNTTMKLGGLSPRRCGFGFEARKEKPTAEQIAHQWRPYVETCIEQFGPSRCMFESNFPPDNAAGTYRTVWNALKLTASGYSATEKEALFSGTARRVYALPAADGISSGKEQV